MSSIRETAERIAAPTIGKVAPAVYREIVADIEQALGDELRYAIQLVETEIPVGGGKPLPLETVRPHVKAILRMLRERAGAG